MEHRQTGGVTFLSGNFLVVLGANVAGTALLVAFRSDVESEDAADEFVIARVGEA